MSVAPESCASAIDLNERRRSVSAVPSQSMPNDVLHKAAEFVAITRTTEMKVNDGGDQLIEDVANIMEATGSHPVPG